MFTVPCACLGHLARWMVGEGRGATTPRTRATPARPGRRLTTVESRRCPISATKSHTTRRRPRRSVTGSVQSRRRTQTSCSRHCAVCWTPSGGGRLTWNRRRPSTASTHSFRLADQRSVLFMRPEMATTENTCRRSPGHEKDAGRGGVRTQDVRESGARMDRQAGQPGRSWQ